MPEQRRRFSAQFKAEAVHVIETEKPVAEGRPGPGDQRGHAGQLGQRVATGDPPVLSSR